MKSSTLIRFSWYAILKAANYDCNKAYGILTKVLTGSYTMPTDTKLDCWLERPVAFLASGATVQQKCVYLHIATRRNWLDYEEKGSTNLPVFIVETLYNIDTLRTNPLLTINEKNIDLKY